MNKELIIRSHSSAVDFALLKDGKLIELNKEVEDNKFSVGDIFVAKIRKAVPGLNAAFVNVGHEKDGFLHYHDLGPKLPSLIKYIKQVSTGKNKDSPAKESKTCVALFLRHDNLILYRSLSSLHGLLL